MGTRNLTVVVANSDYKIAQYCQWDGYISGQGVTILNFLRNEMDSSFKEKVEKCSWITPEQHKQYWVDCGASPDSDMVGMDVSDKFKKKYSHLHRDCGAGILKLVQDSPSGLKLQNEIEFAADSLFCEYAYVVDLDKNTFEIYKGFNQEKLAADERFAFLSEKASREYQPVKLLKSYSLDNLPTEEEMVKDCEPSEEDE